MSKLFYITFNRSNVFYDGYFIHYDDGRIVGYTHDGILTGSSTKIVEISKQSWCDYPIEKEEYIQDRIMLTFQKESEKIDVVLHEKSYCDYNETIVIERVRSKAKMLPENVQIALEQFLT